MVERVVCHAVFEIRVSLGEPDPETSSLFAGTLRKPPAERLADATRAARFVLRTGISSASGAVPEGFSTGLACRRDPHEERG